MQVLLVAGLGVLVVLLSILVIRLHPFLGLLLGTLIVLAFTPQSSWLLSRLGPNFVAIESVSNEGSVAFSTKIASGRYLLWRQRALEPLPTVWQLEPEERPMQPANFHLEEKPPTGSNASRTSTQTNNSDSHDRHWYRLKAFKRASPEAMLEEPEPSENSDNTSVTNAIFSGEAGDRLIAWDKFHTAHTRATAERLESIVDRLSSGLSSTFQKIGLAIAMAALIGVCLLESGAAQTVVQGLGRWLGPQRTAPVLLVSGFVLGIPIFFDTVFYLLLPLAKAYGRSRPGQSLLAVMSIIVGATMAHSLVPPTPGPLLVATQLNVSIGAMMLGGLAVGAITTTVGFLYSKWCNENFNWLAEPVSSQTVEKGPSNSNSTDPSSRSFDMPVTLAALPLAFPIVCLGGAELARGLGVIEALEFQGKNTFASLGISCIRLLGQPGFVLIISATIAYGLLRRAVSAGESLPLISRAIADAGTILLLTCAGGAFGSALQQLGLADAIAGYSSGWMTPSGLLFVAFFTTAMIRVAQGSATVAMITSVAIVAPLVHDQWLPYHPVYVALAIGCGSKLMPWMNDSGFWQVSTMTGMTVQQTLKTFSVALTLMGCTGFIVVLLAAQWLPFP